MVNYEQLNDWLTQEEFCQLYKGLFTRKNIKAAFDNKDLNGLSEQGVIIGSLISVERFKQWYLSLPPIIAD